MAVIGINFVDINEEEENNLLIADLNNKLMKMKDFIIDFIFIKLHILILIKFKLLI